MKTYFKLIFTCISLFFMTLLPLLIEASPLTVNNPRSLTINNFCNVISTQDVSVTRISGHKCKAYSITKPVDNGSSWNLSIKSNCRYHVWGGIFSIVKIDADPNSAPVTITIRKGSALGCTTTPF